MSGKVPSSQMLGIRMRSLGAIIPPTTRLHTVQLESLHLLFSPPERAFPLARLNPDYPLVPVEVTLPLGGVPGPHRHVFSALSASPP